MFKPIGEILDDLTKKKRNGDMSTENSYGFCPKCQGEGISRERCLGGKTRCKNGHIFLSYKWDEWNKNNTDIKTKRKGWRTPYGFIDFTEPKSYDEAVNIMKEQAELIDWDKK